MTMNALRRAAMIAAAVALMTPTAADAGEYRVDACRDRAGQPGLPIGDATSGWRLLAHPAASVASTCAQDYSRAWMYLGFSREHTVPYTDGAFARFVAPPDTTVSAVSWWWRGQAATDPAGRSRGVVFAHPWNAPRFENTNFGDPDNVLASANRVTRTDLDLTSFDLAAVCGRVEGCEGDGSTTPTTMVWIYRAAVTLRDDEGPRGTAAGGAVADATLRGSEPLHLDVTDVGGGVYRLLVDLDGSTVRTIALDPGSGRCRPVHADEPFAFAHPRPCPSSVSSTVELETTTLPEGAHDLRIRLQDAAGNVRDLLPTTQRTIDNVPAPTSLALPAVVGTPQEGRTLVAEPGSWDEHGAATTYAYQWRRCAGAGCEDVPGATGATYDLERADAYKRLRLRVTAVSSEGTTVVESAETDVVRDRDGRSAAPAAAAPAPPASEPSSAGLTSGAQAAPSPGAGGPGLQPSGPLTGGSGSVQEAAAGGGRGAPNGVNASEAARLVLGFSGSGRTTRRQAFGGRVRIIGRLVDAAGRPIAGARVELLGRHTAAGAALLPRLTATTNARGGVALTLAPGQASQTLVAQYRSHLGDAVPVAQAKLALVVRAGVTLAVTPRRAARRGTVRFRGRLLGGPVPRAGKLVELQARARGGRRWITFRTVRTDRAGRFSSRYRFRATYGKVTYEFRARSRADGAYPYATGASRVRAVTVR
jgi:hypothetical protein